MKRTKMLSALALSCVLAGSLCLFAGCEPSDDPGEDKDGPVLNFVATDSTTYSTLTIVTSSPKYSARPAHTPAMMRFDERVSFLSDISFCFMIDRWPSYSICS